MANAAFSWVNHVDSGAVSASSSSGDLNIGNVQSPIVGKRWRGPVTAWGQCDFGGFRSVDVVALVFPRDTTVPISGTVRHYFDPPGGTPGSGATHDSGVINIDSYTGYGYHLYFPSSTVSARYWRWQYNLAGVTFVDTGRAWAGEVFRPAVNVSLGHVDEWLDLSTSTPSPRSGAEFIDRRSRQRRLSFSLGWLDNTERATVRDMLRVVGTSEQVLMVLTPEASDKGREAILGRFEAAGSLRRRTESTSASAVDLIIRESL